MPVQIDVILSEWFEVHGYEHILAVDPNGIGVQPYAGWAADRFTCAVIELTIVSRTLDDVIHDQTVREVNLFMGAIPVSAEERAFRASVNCKCSIFMIEADQVLRLDIIPCASAYPLGH